MNEQPSLEFYAQFILALAGLLVLPAVWSFFSAAYFGATTGQVLVISIGRYETARESVAWVNGWARFVGPIVLVMSLGIWACSKKGARAWWVAVALALVGLFLLLFSKWFTTWHGVMFFAGLNAFIAVTLYAGNRYGRSVAYLIIALGLGFFLWRVSTVA
jgi:hypothetical protein